MSLYTILLYGTSFVLLLVMGLLVFIKDYKSPANRAFFSFTLATILWMMMMFLGYINVPDNLTMALVFFRFAFGVSVLPLFTSFLFFYYFPKKIFHIPRAVLGILYIVTFALAFLGAFTPYIEESIYMSGNVQIDVFGPLYPVYLVYCISQLIFSVMLVTKKIFKSQGLEKKKIAYVAAGFFIVAILATITNVILPTLGIVLLQNESVAFSVVFFASAFYSIYRQRFFNLTYVSLNFLRRMLLILFFLVFLLIVHLSLERLIPENNYVVLLLSAIIAFLTYGYFEKIFPNFYSSTFHNFKKSVAEFGTKIFDCKTYDEFTDLLEMTFLERLNIKTAKIFWVEKKIIEDIIPTYLEDRFTHRLQKIKDVVVADELADKKSEDRTAALFIEKMKELEAKLCFPLFSEGKLIGFFTLGSKTKKDIYTREEIEEILKVKPSIQTCLMNLFIANTLREENDIMKKIISERTETLKKNNEKLEKMVQQQDNFISLTAHEFRTPLTVAMLGLEQISYLYKKRIPADVISDVETSYNQLDKLTNLINRLLEMRRVEENKVPVVLENVDLVPFVKEIVKSIQLIANINDIEIIFLPPRVKSVNAHTDKIKLQEVLDNLLQNAIKFTPQHGKIKVTLTIDTTKRQASISIEDNGVGIPKKDLNIIFEKFQQGSRYNKGVGIGLYLCKQYMQLLQGTIKVKSKVGKGSTFTIEFPLK